ncbi:MAG TPA: hypothetical protein VL171_09650 [Verrucomicrobiae bacterium]|nr:hypothetical protein [Verrucomicrobiae bacterium]
MTFGKVAGLNAVVAIRRDIIGLSVPQTHYKAGANPVLVIGGGTASPGQ